jgi:hypothetical protein
MCRLNRDEFHKTIYIFDASSRDTDLSLLAIGSKVNHVLCSNLRALRTGNQCIPLDYRMRSKLSGQFLPEEYPSSIAVANRAS